MNLTKEQKMAYTEVCAVLNNMDQSDVAKIPSDILAYYKNNSDKSYNFQLDKYKPFNQQKLSYTAEVVLAILFRDYWATPEQRNRIVQKEKYDLKKIEEEKRKKYDPNFLSLNTNNTNNKVINSNKEKEQSQSLALIKEEKWYNKILNYFKRFFNHNSK